MTIPTEKTELHRGTDAVEAPETTYTDTASPHGRIKVLMYHRILDCDRVEPDQRAICVSAGTFERQLAALQKWGFTPITFLDYYLALDDRLVLPRRPIIITFDDGYLDTFTIAYPILRKFGMKAVVFVLGDRHVASNRWDVPRHPEAPLMNDQQILELHADGFEIGSHSLTHARLLSVGRQLAWEEISRSRMVLEILLNAPVRTFAYPYGLLDQGIKEMVKSAGYSLGCAVYTGPAVFARDPFEVRRIQMPEMSMGQFALRILAPYEKLLYAYWRLKTMVRGRGAAAYAGSPEGGVYSNESATRGGQA